MANYANLGKVSKFDQRAWESVEQKIDQSSLHRLCIDTFMVCDAGYLRESFEQEIC